MSSSIPKEEHDPVANLTMQPVRGILKTSKSIEESRLENTNEHVGASNNYSTAAGMTRSESKSHKIPHFDEMNIIATYHPANKDYGHMKIEEPKTPYAPSDNIDEDMDTEFPNEDPTHPGVDPDLLAQRLNESSIPSCKSNSNRPQRRSIDETFSDESEHRKQFEKHRKQHYNEFEIVRLHKKEIEAELRALEQEEEAASTAIVGSKSEKKENEMISSSNETIRPILVHHPHSRDSSTSSHHHVHVEDDIQHEIDEQSLTPEERERKRQFELKRKKHYNEFRVAHSMDKDDEK